MNKKKIYLLFIWLLLFGLLPTAPVHAQTCQYWVAPPPVGRDSNPGTATQPWATIQHAITQVPDASCTILVKPGIYTGLQDVERRFNTRTIIKATVPYKAILENYGAVLSISGGKNMTFSGFEFRHAGPGSDVLVVEVRRSGNTWAENIIFQNNIFHDSYNNDILKIYDGSRNIVVQNNIFYNQGEGEQHMDVNGVENVTIQDNIFFNDYAGSGRSIPANLHTFIVIKDSNGNADGQLGSRNVTVRRNIFLNWQGAKEPFIQVGNDGKPYIEATNITVENNLMIGNSTQEMIAAFAVSGATNVRFINNTITGNLPASAYAFRIVIKDQNPKNQNIFFYNNIWSDPTGTMGAGLNGGNNQFSSGDPSATKNLILDNNLYWNGGKAIPPGDVASPSQDTHRRVANPRLNTNQTNIVLPRWNGATFLSGKTTIRQEFIRLVNLYGKIPANSPAIGKANPTFAPSTDILRRIRRTPDLGAYEYISPTTSSVAGITFLTLPFFTP